jgi:hypothetical protein
MVAFSFASAQEEKVVLPGGQGPHFYIVLAINHESLVIERVPPPTKEVNRPRIVYKRAFKDIRANDAKGKALTPEEVGKRLKPGSVVVVGGDNSPVQAAYLAVLKDDTVVLNGVVPLTWSTRAEVENGRLIHE